MSASSEISTETPTGLSATAVSHRRPDIQGLRAVAVLLVTTFHAGLPVPGGFLGVDVFFVISGFVITSMLEREWSVRGRIDFAKFYSRRFKRLTPALALTVSFTVVSSALLLPPLEVQTTVAQTGAGAMLSMANAVIAYATSDYFDASAASNPLLNTWSLSVEEQFYLVFPLVLLLGWLWARKARLPALSIVGVGAIAVVSFGCATWGALGFGRFHVPLLLGFYSPLTRAWEFAAGSMLALVAPKLLRTPRFVSFTLAALGGAVMVISAAIVTESAPLRGPWGLLPVSATLLLLMAGQGGTNPISRALGARPMVKLGDWSYSIYLWHWPLIVFAIFIWPQSAIAPVAAALISFLPALAAYHWLEAPIRHWRPGCRRHWGVLIAGVMIPPLVLAGTVLLIQSTMWAPMVASGQWTMNEGDVGHSDFYAYVRGHNYPCTQRDLHYQAPDHHSSPRCQQSKRGPDVTVALVGDSHAESLFLGLSEALSNRNVAYYIASGSLPTRRNADMSTILDDVAASRTIKTVIISAHWSSHGSIPTEELVDTLRELTDAGKRVFITDDIPNFPFDAGKCKYRKAMLLPVSDCSMRSESFAGSYSSYFPALSRAVKQVSGVTMINTAHYFCDPVTCNMVIGGKLMYRDGDHLNIPGSRFIAKKMLQDNPALPASLSPDQPMFLGVGSARQVQ